MPKNFNKSHSNYSDTVNLYLDSIIAPSALNNKFYEEIYSLAPFGSGNSEPKFVIENLHVITTNIISDKHIKSILRGSDGSVFKSVAFNAIDTPLEPLLSKNSKKKFI